MSDSIQPSTMGGEDFAALLDASFGEQERFAGQILTGRVVRVTDDVAIVDVGLKSEGRIPLREFAPQGSKPAVQVGDTIDLWVERYEDRDGNVVLSRERARREEVMDRLERAMTDGEKITGTIFGRIKGGFSVDLGGPRAFLPGSQLDIRPTRDPGDLMGKPTEFRILKIERAANNIVVSRRAVLEESRAGLRAELMKTLKEGAVVEGVVKNTTEYGAFIDLGGVDGLLHVTDMAHARVRQPSDVVSIGDKVQVKVLRYNTENGRISLGMKQLQPDPWESLALRYPVGSRLTGRVTNVAEFGAFVEIEPGIEGLVHVSEMGWGKEASPAKLVSTSQEVDVVVLEVDEARRRLSLGMKQAMRNPWEVFLEEHPLGSTVEGAVRNITEFGLFVAVADNLDGMVHLSDLSWDERGETAITAYNKGDAVTAKVLDVDVEKGRISLGIKQLAADPAAEVLDRVRKGDIVTATVSQVQSNGIEVTVDEVLTGFIRRAELGRDREDQRPDRFSVGQTVDARVTAVDRAGRRLALTIKGKEVEEDRAAVKEYGSADSGASLGDILGAAIRRRNQLAE